MNRHFDMEEPWLEFKTWAQDKTSVQAWNSCTRGDWMLYLLGHKSGQRGWPTRMQLVSMFVKILEKVCACTPDGTGLSHEALIEAKNYVGTAGQSGEMREIAIKAHAASVRSANDAEACVLELAACTCCLSYSMRPWILSTMAGLKLVEMSLRDKNFPSVPDMIRSACPVIPEKSEKIMEGICVLTAINTHTELEKQAKSCGVPWMFVGSQVCAFADYLRGQGVYFVQADDPETINRIQPSLREGRDCFFGLPNGHLFVHPKDTALKVLDYHGQQHMAGMWATAKPHLEKFLDHLYTYNVFVARADAGGKALLDEKTKLQNITIRMRVPESETL